MDSFELLYISLSAFVAVFVVLLVLSVFMRLIIMIFPAQEKDDVTVYAALASTLNKIYPGTQITKIEELK